MLPEPGVVTPAPPARVDAMRAALVLAHVAVQLGEVDADMVFRTAGDAHDESTTVDNLVAVAQSLAELLGGLFRYTAMVDPAEDPVTLFEAAVPPVATWLAPPPEEAAE